MNLLWFACIASQCAAAYWIVSSPKLRTKYLLLAAYLMYMSAASVLRFSVGHNARLYLDYERIWTVTAWPLIIFSILAGMECVLSLNRQYGDSNRRFTLWASAIAGAIFLVLSALEAWFVEVPVLWRREREWVNVATILTRVVSATLAALLLAQWWLMRFKPLPISGNLHCARLVLGCYFALDAAVHYATALGWGRFDHVRLLNALAVVALTGSILCWSWLLWRLREAHEWDVQPLPMSADDARLIRDSREMIRQVQRHAWKRIAQAFHSKRPLRSL